MDRLKSKANQLVNIMGNGENKGRKENNDDMNAISQMIIEDVLNENDEEEFMKEFGITEEKPEQEPEQEPEPDEEEAGPEIIFSEEERDLLQQPEKELELLVRLFYQFFYLDIN